MVLFAASAFTVGSVATFSAATENAGNVFAADALSAPTGFTGAMAGGALQFPFTAGLFDSGAGGVGTTITSYLPATSGTTITGAAPTCVTTPATYTLAAVETNVSPATLTATTNQGRWDCFMARASYPYPAGSKGWYSISGNPVAAVQRGYVVRSVALANGGVLSRVDQGDTITVTFNQPVNHSVAEPFGGPVCTRNTGDIIYIGTNHDATTCANTETSLYLLKLLPKSGMTHNQNATFLASYAWSADSTTVTVLIGVEQTGGNVALTCTGACVAAQAWTANTSSTNLANIPSATGAVSLCTVNPSPIANGLCLPEATGQF